MSLKFTKMNGLGNDFIVINAINQTVKLNAQQIAQLALRHTGVGFDQCLILDPSQNPDVDFFYRIFNADGQEVGQCGNGARCLARFIQYYGLSQHNPIRVATRTTQMNLHLNPDHSVTVDLGQPRWEPKDIPINAVQMSDTYDLPMSQGAVHFIHGLSVGNPHAVSVVSDVTTIDVKNFGKSISEHPQFPEQCNASFMQIINPERIKLRVYERGCGETAACGSAAVAAAAVGRRFYQMAQRIQVDLPGGTLWIEWPSLDDAILLTGPATFVYEGSLFPCAL